MYLKEGGIVAFYPLGRGIDDLFTLTHSIVNIPEALH